MKKMLFTIFFAPLYFYAQMPEIEKSETFFLTDIGLYIRNNFSTFSEMQSHIKEAESKFDKYIIQKTNSNSGIITHEDKYSITKYPYSNNLLNGTIKTTFKKIRIVKITELFSTDLSKIEVNFKNGKMNGIYKIVNKNGKTIIITNYKDNILNGTTTLYTNGVLTGNYVNGKLVGDLTFESNNGYKYTLPNDLKRGKVKTFFNNELINEFDIIDGKTNGELIEYYEGGNKIRKKIPYFLGKINGSSIEYDINGKIIEKNN